MSKQPKFPTGEELVESIQRYFEQYTKAKLEENEQWRRDSYRVDWPPRGSE
jgi:hypothetical protein